MGSEMCIRDRVWGAIELAGLDPFAGFLHVDRPGKPSMVLDLIEEFRQQVVDRTVFGLVNRGYQPKLEDGKLSEETRKEFSLKIYRTGLFDIDTKLKDIESEEYKDILFDLNKDTISDPIKGKNGYYVFKIVDQKYPEFNEIIKLISEFSKNIITINALELAEKAGSSAVMNIVILGAAMKRNIIPISYESVIETIKEYFPEKYRDMNIKAFKLGFEST